MRKFKFSASVQILIALVLGIAAGLLANHYSIAHLVTNWVSPIGLLFIQMLKLIAIPLIIVSLLSGFSGLGELSNLSKMGGRTVLAFIATTVFAVSLGLVISNIIQPGTWVSEATRADLLNQFPITTEVGDDEPASLKFLLNIFPENFIAAATDNKNMLQIIFTVILFAVAMLKSSESTRLRLSELFHSLNEVVMKVIDFIMLLAPLGVFALMADVVVNAPKTDLMLSLLGYAFTVVLGLAILVFIFYPVLVKWLAGMRYSEFLKGILPAQLLAISTSSSAATLPVTMECVNNNLNVRPEVSSFVLPIGATVNMDGTSLYQAVAAMFIAQAYGIELNLMQQLTIVVTATLASIGAAAVPGAGLIMLTIVLEQVGVPLSGLGLILAMDRPLDMLRTAVNITSDAAIAKILDHKIR